MWTADSLHPEGPRYLALVDRIQRDIAEGRLLPGMRLPPQREVAATLGIDLTTVSRAYTEARRRGLIAGHVGRGTFVREQVESASLGASPAGESAAIDLSLNLPPAAVVELAERALAKTLRELPDSPTFRSVLAYQPNAGRPDHREAGAEWVRRRGVERPADQVVVTAGAQHALTVLLTTCCSAGATVMAEELTYPVFKALADQLHLRVLGLRMDGEGILPDSFRDACAKGARVLYCTPTLQNPTSALMGETRRRQVADIANEFDVVVIEDDVYGMLPRSAPPALSVFAPERSYFIASLSKTVAPGLRTAFVAAPTERAARQTAAGVRATTWMAAPLTAEIASTWIRDGVASRLVAANQREANVRQRAAAEALDGHAWTAHPEGYHGWLELPESWSTAEFVMQVRRLGVVVAPGDAFAVGDRLPPRGVRLGLCAAASLGALQQALRRISRLLETGPDEASSLL